MNTFLGNAAGAHNTSGYNNVFVGGRAGTANVGGNSNVFVGPYAGGENTSGYNNVFFGNLAGFNNIEGINNTFIGYSAGYSMKIGDYNTFIGDGAGGNNESGGHNIFIGHEAGGYEGGSYKLYIDSCATSIPLIYGDFQSDYLIFHGKTRIDKTSTTAPTHLLDVGTTGAYCDGAAWVDGSSRDFKKNIVELTSEEALLAFEKLQPVKFQYKENSKDEIFLGFIAEDVPDLVAMNDRKGLNPMDMVAMLTKVVQEQQKAILKLEDKIAQLEKKGLEEE